MSFMMAIEAAQPPPLEQLARDYFVNRSGTQSVAFCRRVLGVASAGADDKTIAKRLGVAISTVRAWQDVGRSR